MSGSSPPPSSSPLTYNESEPPLVAEMWGLLKALATQLHVNIEPAAPSSSSTATEPSPVQGNRCKDKAPVSLEDSKDDNKDISKSIPGGKSSSLAQGSGTPLYNVGSLDPRAELLSNSYEDIIRAVRKVSIGTHCSFPPNYHSPRRISSMSPRSASSSRPYTQRSSYALAWQRMVACWWTSTPSSSPSSTPCACS